MSKVFVKREKKVKPGFNIAVIFNKQQVNGDIGLEVEVEGKRLPLPEDTPAPWRHTVDHSLRGEENAEYVLQHPIPFDEVPDALGKLWAAFDAKKSVLDDANRTSVHVHLNCQKFHFNRLASFCALYFAFEEILTEWCGDHRVGNLFCLRGVDAPGIVSTLKRFIQNDGKSVLSEQLHYGGLNIQALSKFGSLEIRTMRGVQDQQTLVDWVAVLRRLYDVSETFPDPREICYQYSAEGPDGFLDGILGAYSGLVREKSGLNSDEIRSRVFSGIRLTQSLCFCRDWDEFKAMDLQPDPFGRDAKKMMKMMQAMESQAVPVASDNTFYDDDFIEPEYDEPLGDTIHLQSGPGGFTTPVVPSAPAPNPFQQQVAAFTTPWNPQTLETFFGD